MNYFVYELLRTCFSRILVTDKETHIVQNRCLTKQSFLNKITISSLLNFFFSLSLYALDAYLMHSNFTCNHSIFERIFISDFSIWILVFSMLNLHFSVNYKDFQCALAFLIFQGIISYYMKIVYRRVHLSGILSKLGHFLLLKRKFSYDPPTKPSSIYFVKRFLKS